MAQHIAPAAFPAVLGSKADLISQRKVEISDVLVGFLMEAENGEEGVGGE